MHMLPRARFLQETPAFARLLRQLQCVTYEEWPEFIDPAQAGMPDPLPWAGSLVLALAQPPGHLGHFQRRLSGALTRLSQALEQHTLACLPVACGASWHGSVGAHPHPPLQRARQQAVAHQMPDGFDGAWAVAPHELPALMPLWFWSERCNAVQGGLAFTWGLEAVFGQICAHGNLHLDVYDKPLLQRLRNVAPACGWAPVAGTCVEIFGRGGRIAGRSLKV
jgi:hypothetical protein